MYKYNPFIMQNIRANTLIIGANNNPINKKVRLNADFSINYKKLFKFYSKIILWQRYASWLRAYRPCIHSQWSVS